ncbi:MAG TPA: hypothetical protein VEY71_13025, partial [Chitinophagales bacterium]|nr:hypothetical protein [Chitinophagales bacterium]
MRLFPDKNIFKRKDFLPIDIGDFMSYVAGEPTQAYWHGVSFQLDIDYRHVKPEVYLEYQEQFKKLIDKSLSGDWVIQPYQPRKLFEWCQDDDNDKQTTGNLKRLLQSSPRFKGYLIVANQEITDLFKDLFLFSFLTHSQDLMLFSSGKPLVVQFGQHLTLDVISTDFLLIENMIALLEEYRFVVKIYQ